MDVVVVALIVSVIAPVIMTFLTAMTRRAEKREDWARQDEVAKRAESSARAIVASNERIADTVIETNGETSVKLDVIHTLVNSQLTKAIESERDAVQRELAMMEEMVAIKKKLGDPPSGAVLAAISLTRAKLNELNGQLEERAKQQEIVDMQLNQEKQVASNLKTTLEAVGVEFPELDASEPGKGGA